MGRFWHKRVDVLSRVENYVLTRIPEAIELQIQDPDMLDGPPAPPPSRPPLFPPFPARACSCQLHMPQCEARSLRDTRPPPSHDLAKVTHDHHHSVFLFFPSSSPPLPA